AFAFTDDEKAAIQDITTELDKQDVPSAAEVPVPVQAAPSMPAVSGGSVSHESFMKRIRLVDPNSSALVPVDIIVPLGGHIAATGLSNDQKRNYNGNIGIGMGFQPGA